VQRIGSTRRYELVHPIHSNRITFVAEHERGNDGRHTPLLEDHPPQ
jgi:hypothetical protein